MKQALAVLLGGAFTAASCYAIGTLFLERFDLTKAARLRSGERLPLVFLVGAALLHLLIFGIFLAQVAYWPVLIAPLLVAIVWSIRSGAWGVRGVEFTPLPRILRLLLIAGFVWFGGAYFLIAWAPERSPDGSSYHLGIIARFLQNRGYEPVTTTIYAMLGQGVEMLFAPAFAIGRHSAAALVEFAFSVALGLAILAYGRRIGKPWAGGAAAMLTFLAPVVGKTASAAYIDVATAAIVFGCFYWLELWDEERNPALLIPAGLLAGYAFAAKFTAFTIGVYAVLFVLFKARRAKPLLVLAGCAALTAGPWIVRNMVVYRNPAAPLLNKTFRNPYVHPSFEMDYTAYFRRYEVKDLRTLPLEVTIGGGKTAGLIGPAFLLLPLGLFALRYRAGRHAMLAGLLVLATYPANVGTRFLIPVLPFASLAIALAFRESAALLGLLIVFHGYTSWYRHIPKYADPYAWRIDAVPWKAALRVVSPDEFLNSHMGYPMARMIDGLVPEGQSVLTSNGVPDSYTRREIRVSFQSASNQALFDIMQMGWDPAAQPLRAKVFHFSARSVRRIRVVQTGDFAATPAMQWSAHEIRYYNGPAELARAPEWRLRAWPTPQYVQAAFDNSPVTRWRPWETAMPGQWIETDFGRDMTIDQVRVETCFNDLAAKLAIETMSEAGNWVRVDAAMEEIDVPPPPSIRREATRELALRGIHYFSFYDTDFGAEDYREDPEAWGLVEIGRAGGARLYKSIWP